MGERLGGGVADMIHVVQSFFAPGDGLFERFLDRGVECGCSSVSAPVAISRSRAGRRRGAVDLRAFVGVRIGQQRKERALVPLQRVRGAEEVAAWRTEAIASSAMSSGATAKGLDGLRYHLQHLDIEHDLLERSGEAGLDPAAP